MFPKCLIWEPQGRLLCCNESLSNCILPKATEFGFLETVYSQLTSYGQSEFYWLLWRTCLPRDAFLPITVGISLTSALTGTARIPVLCSYSSRLWGQIITLFIIYGPAFGPSQATAYFTVPSLSPKALSPRVPKSREWWILFVPQGRMLLLHQWMGTVEENVRKLTCLP